MVSRAALVAVVFAASVGTAAADDDNFTNTSEPTQAPTTVPPAGTTFTTEPALKGSTCMDVGNIKSMGAGTAIRLQDDQGFQDLGLTGAYTTQNCIGTPVARRLQPGNFIPQPGSLSFNPALLRTFPAGSSITSIATGGPTCFPGDATVNVYGQGATRVASVSVGDHVLVGRDFEPVLGFLHKVTGVEQESMTVEHAQGTFRASENHIVFTSRGDMPVSALRPGDDLLVQGSSSPILSVGKEITTAGMYAPLTPSGALVVDGVVASNYGTPSSGMSLPHGAAHAAFFALRVYHYLGGGDSWATTKATDAIVHPFPILTAK